MTAPIRPTNATPTTELPVPAPPEAPLAIPPAVSPATIHATPPVMSPVHALGDGPRDPADCRAGGLPIPTPAGAGPVSVDPAVAVAAAVVTAAAPRAGAGVTATAPSQPPGAQQPAPALTPAQPLPAAQPAAQHRQGHHQSPAGQAPAPRRRLRSRRVALALAGASMMALAACEDRKVDAEAFPDLDSCLAAAQKDSLFFTADDCRTAFADAKKNWEETAPRYENKALCEQEHGAGNCGGDPVAQPGGGFSFMPLFVGYMLGSMLGRGGGVFSQPMIRNGAGGFTTPNGGQSFASNRGTGKVAPATFNRAPTTAGRAPMSAAQVSQRGGFGNSATRSTGTSRSTGGTRSYGG